MAVFNPKRVKQSAATIKNLANGPAYAQDWKGELVSLLLTSMVQDQFYRSAQQGFENLAGLVENRVLDKDRQFVAKAGIYARNEFGLRSVSHLLAFLVGMNYGGSTWTKRFFDKIVRRPDDMAEIIGLVMAHKKPLPNALRKGFAEALLRFDAYQLAKYKMGARSISLVDIVNLIHPKPNAAINQLMAGTLAPADTWETRLSEAGQNKEDKAAAKTFAWTDLLVKNKLGYMALVKNVRNLLAEKVDMALLCERLTDEKAIKKSLLLPFRFVTAYEEIGKVTTGAQQSVLRALNKAAEISLGNVPVFPGATLVVLDQSGSMNSAVGTSTAARVGALFSAMLWKRNDDCDVIVFGTHAQYVNPTKREDSLLNLAQFLGTSDRGGTNFSAPFAMASRKYDRIVILSDMQGWIEESTPFQGAFQQYCAKNKANPHLYSMDLCGYGTLQFPQDKVYLLAGFSDKIFDVMRLLESDRNALIKKIEAVDL